MQSFFRFLLCLACVLSAGACSHHRIIPDDKLALIFHDAFLANAYLGTRNLAKDSLNVYEPIFARYGYTTQDVHYTIGNFSKRKSARLGDVVERAIDLLEAEGKFFNREVAVLDTVDNVALRAARRTLRADSLLRVRSLADTARVSFVFDVAPGEYEVRLRYLVDSLDLNTRGLRSQMWLERDDSSRVQTYTVSLRRLAEGTLSRKFSADSTHRRLRVHLLTFTDAPRRPSVSVRDLRITHTLPTGAAVEQLYEQQLGIRIFADEFFSAAAPKDTL
ncbi:MAG: DUF4296 domain-containing protein [Alistipes sp.]|nr:DUF4296 domain-containing protein [Alistipes sp.]MDE5694961.1 DUF4296 domain-containing protein [Alistipes sp.]MDE6508098.1 DUF4296 domain-containing protein [Alistipes sp.]